MKEQLRHEIQIGRWQPGEQIPTESQLCQQFEVSRVTVRLALSSLVQEGLLHRIQGKGTFVAQPKFVQEHFRLKSFSNSMRELGHQPSLRPIAQMVIRADHALAANLGIPSGSRVTEVVRVRMVDDEPFAVESLLVPYNLAPGLEEEDLTHAVFLLLMEKYGVILAGAKKFIEAVPIDEYESKLLGVKVGWPALLIERKIALEGTDSKLMSRWVIRGDRCRFSLESEDEFWYLKQPSPAGTPGI